jgi:hypothetical protein
MSIQPRTKRTIVSGTDFSWVAPGGIEALQHMDSVVLDRSTFDFDAVFTNGYLPAGVVLGKVTATGLYGLYADAGAGGLDTAVGFLGADIPVSDLLAATVDELAPLLWRGEIDESNLPTGHGLTSAAKVDLAAKFRFV